jgi:hypothetical protein
VSARATAALCALLLALAFAPALAAGALVARFAVDVPTWDDFERAPLLAAWKEGRLGLDDLYALHIEHRIVVPRLLALANTAWLGGDLRVENGFAVAILLAEALAVHGLLRRTLDPAPRRLIALTFLANLLLFSPLQWENLLWAIQTAFFLPFACAALGLLALHSRGPLPARFAAAGAAAIVGTHSFSHGLGLWPLFFGAVLLRRDFGTPRARVAFLAAWVALAGAVLVPYFTVGGFQNASLHAYDTAVGERPPALSLADLPARAPRAIQFFLALLGSPLSRNALLPEMATAREAGALVLGLYGLAIAGVLARWRDRALWDRALPWLALGGYAVLAAALAGLGRSVFLPWRGALLPHYATLGLVALAALAGLSAVVLDAWVPRIRSGRAALRGLARTAPAFAAGLLAGVTGLTWLFGVNGMYEWHSSRLQARTSLLYLEHFTPRHARRLDGQLQVARDMAGLLDRHGLMRPRLAPDLRLTSEFAVDETPAPAEAARVTRVVARAEHVRVWGFGWLPEAGRRSDGVLITARDAAGERVVVGVAEVHGLPWLPIARQDHLFNVVLEPGPADFGAFSGTIETARLPDAPELELEAWGVDAERMRVRRFGQTLAVRRGAAGVSAEVRGEPEVGRSP